ncbi:zinc metallopeptidase [Desertivirga arenae]|uniref:zinc metallopeptidase n=1 Tax=Desertivirga arenae TaxID=2810309 RepID=UPI001A9663B5|nr:zinc metallopeptidase [Pedobacter sp. SYSU D00823]
MNIGFILFIVIAIISMIIQYRFKSKFNHYAESPLGSGLTGRDVAERMLRDNGIFDVQIRAVEGSLSDHYNPADRTVNLSPEVYHGRSIAAAAVAAHECGHAVQHAKSYNWLNLRSAMVPMVNIASNLLQWVFMLGFILLASGIGYHLLLVAFGAMVVVTLFSVVTLPVEFDASNRALAWLNVNKGIMQTSAEHNQAKDALWWAAMTYVVAALGSVAQLVYLGLMLFGGRRND